MRSHEDILLKVCGIANTDDGIYASECGADIIGVILDTSVARHGDANLITDLKDRGIRVAGVYTSAEAALKECRDEDMVQLHFAHDAELVSAIKKRIGKGIISVIQFTETAGLIEKAEQLYRAGADIVLLESRGGILHHISEVGKIQKSLRTGVSGKISPDNVSEFVRINPQMIDLSSSLEIYPGKKDHRLIKKLFSNLEVA